MHRTFSCLPRDCGKRYSVFNICCAASGQRGGAGSLQVAYQRRRDAGTAGLPSMLAARGCFSCKLLIKARVAMLGVDARANQCLASSGFWISAWCGATRNKEARRCVVLSVAAKPHITGAQLSHRPIHASKRDRRGHNRARDLRAESGVCCGHLSGARSARAHAPTGDRSGDVKDENRYGG